MFNMDPKAMAGMMKQLGLKTEELKTVKITVELEDGKVMEFENATLMIMDMKGQKMYQINGEPTIVSNGPPPASNDEDIKMIMEQAHCTREQAEQALKDSNGDIAEAIMTLENK